MYPSQGPPPPPYPYDSQPQQQPHSQQGDLAGHFQGMNVSGHFRPHMPHLSHHLPHLPSFGHGQHNPEIICGPLLRYIGTQEGRWVGSCLVVSDREPLVEIELLPSSNQQSRFALRAEKLDSFRHRYYFWRYEINVPLRHHAQVARYTCNGQSFDFHLPAADESMRFMFHSCNGFSDIPQELKDKLGEKEPPLWLDVLDRHEVMPFHVLIGGGDQLYQDRLMKEDFMQPWREEKDPAVRLAMRLPGSMRDSLEEFYFSNYVKNFGFKDNPVVAKAFATIPSLNMWDDHDIIDGYGSYPTDMQNADMFQVLFANACRFYYLFQQHTTPELAGRHGMIPGYVEKTVGGRRIKPCNSIVVTLGPDIGIVSLDCRGERTKQDVCHPETYNRIFYELERLPNTVKHLLLVTGVPLVYPRLTLFEKAMDSASSFNLTTLAGKTGALGNVITGQLNKWNGDPELLDDMNDHWTAANHEIERKTLIVRLQKYARERSVRVSFIGGDVHCCGAGKLFSKDLKDKEEGDPNLMVQIISSAIVNVPPPQALLTILNQNSSFITFEGNVQERMYNIFKQSPNGNTRQNKKLMGTRNYCAGYYDKRTNKLNFWIQAETEPGVKGTKGYLVDVPRLMFGHAGLQLYGRQPSQTMAPGGMATYPQ